MKNVPVSFISYTINNSWNDWDVDNKSFKKKINLIFRISREDGRPFNYCKNDSFLGTFYIIKSRLQS